MKLIKEYKAPRGIKIFNEKYGLDILSVIVVIEFLVILWRLK